MRNKEWIRRSWNERCELTKVGEPRYWERLQRVYIEVSQCKGGRGKPLPINALSNQKSLPEDRFLKERPEEEVIIKESTDKKKGQSRRGYSQ